MEGSRQGSRGKKRSRPQQQTISENLEESFEQDNKRRRVEHSGIWGAAKNAFSTVYNYFFGGSSSIDPKMPRSSLNAPNGDDDIRIVHDSRQSRKVSSKKSRPREDEDEIQIVEEVHNNSPDLASMRFHPVGHSTVLSSTMKVTTPFFVSTGEKLDWDRRERSRPESILKKLKEHKITARTSFATSPSFWHSPMSSGISKPTIKRRSFTSRHLSGTPRGQGAKAFCYRPQEFEQYQSLLKNIVADPVTNDSLVKILDYKSHLSPVGRSPIFKRSSPAKPIQHHSYLRRNPAEEKSILEQLEKYKKKPHFQPAVVTLDEEDPIRSRPKSYEGKDDRDVIEVLDTLSPRKSSPTASKKSSATSPTTNSLASELEVLDIYKPEFLASLRQKYDTRRQDREILIEEEKIKLDHANERCDKLARSVEERMRRHLAITEVAIPEPEEESEDEECTELPELTPEMESEIDQILSRPQNATLVEAHNIAITRKDLDTLRGLNWLNDEIINFYMQMIVARSASTDNWPKVYAMNTFFLPKLRTAGYAALKRWTRKVDIFSYDIILVPVHLDVHWCLAIINLKKKGVYFYDSMGSDKSEILKLLLKYLEQEHMDKKKSTFDTSGFEMVNVKDIPRQMNGSDCGVFTLKYAEYLSRNANITFTQDDMPYYRRRMVYEIVKNTVIHP